MSSQIVASVLVEGPKGIKDICPPSLRGKVELDGCEVGSRDEAVLYKDGELMIGGKLVWTQKKSVRVVNLRTGKQCTREFTAVFVGRREADLALAVTVKANPNLLPGHLRHRNLIFPGGEVLETSKRGKKSEERRYFVMWRGRELKLELVLREVSSLA